MKRSTLIAIVIHILSLSLLLPLWDWLHWFRFGGSPLDHYNEYYFIASLLLLALHYRYFLAIFSDNQDTKSDPGPVWDKRALFLIVPTLLLYCVAMFVPIRFLQGLFAWTLVWGLAWFLWGWLIFLVCTPIFCLFVFSTTTITYQLDSLFLQLFSSRLLPPQLLKLGLGVILVCLFLLFVRTSIRSVIIRIQPQVAAFSLFILLGIGILYGLNFESKSLAISCHPSFSVMSLQEWTGTSLGLTPGEIRYFGGNYGKKNVFFNVEGDRIYGIYVSSEHDIHRIHPPEYCITGGGGWISSRRIKPLTLGDKTLNVRAMVTENEGYRSLTYYWFSSDSWSTPSHLTFRKKAPLVLGEHMALYRFSINIRDSVASAEAKLDQFLNTLL